MPTFKLSQYEFMGRQIGLLSECDHQTAEAFYNAMVRAASNGDLRPDLAGALMTPMRSADKIFGYAIAIGGQFIDPIFLGAIWYALERRSYLTDVLL